MSSFEAVEFAVVIAEEVAAFDSGFDLVERCSCLRRDSIVAVKFDFIKVVKRHSCHRKYQQAVVTAAVEAGYLSCS